MHTIIETVSFLASAKIAKIESNELKGIVDFMAKNPKAGDLIIGSGGCRKVRIAGKGKGKSGGYRLISFYANENFPLCLWLIYSKGQTENLTKEQIKELAALSKAIMKEIK